MESQIWVVSTLLISIVLIVLTIVKLKFHPFLALLLASFFVGAMMGMGPLEMVNAIESGIGGTLGFLAAVIGLGTILGKMMEVSGAAERIGLTLQRCRWLSADVIMVLVGLICGITLFVEVGVVLLIPLAFSIAKKTNTSLLKLAIPLCTALMAVHCVVPPHPAALFVANKLGADIGTVIVYGLLVGLIASLVGGGNLTEEYASLPTLLGAYAALRVFLRPDWTKRLFAPALLMGVCTMAAFLLRANNALPLAALTLTLSLCLLAKKQFAPLGQCAAGFAAGLALCALPVVIWLAARGALRAAWYGAIVHNMRYTETGSTGRVAMLLHSRYGLAAMLMAALACLGALALRKKSPMLALGMAAAAAAGALAAFLSRKFYDHYLILGAPMAVLGLAATLAAIQKPRVRAVSAIVLTCCCALWLGINGHAANRTRLSERADWAQFTADAQALMAQVPQDERDRFMAYRVEPRWYVAAEALPCMRFYFLQEVLAQADPAVMDEIVQTFETDPPRWLVIYYNRAFNPPYDARVAAIFETNYEFVDAAGQYQLLRLKEGLPCEPNS